MAMFSILLIVGLIGCGNDSSTSSGKNKKVTISIAWWGDTERNKKYNDIADEFEKEHPNIEVKRQFGNFNDYWDKLATQTAGGNAPDVVSMHARYVADYARRNTLIDLGKYVDSGTIDLSDFPKSVVDSGKVDGKTYMVAQGVTTSGEIVNYTQIKKLGVEPFDDNWTWDDFVNRVIDLQEAIKTKGLKGTWAIDDQSSHMQPNFEYFLRTQGKEIYTADGKLGFDKADVVNWFKMWDKLRKAGAIPDAATGNEYKNVSLEQSLFVKDKVLIHDIPANQLYLYQDQLKNDDLGMIRYPQGEDGTNGEYVEGAYLSITKGSKHPKEAAEFINFFVNSEKALGIFKVEQGAPGSTKMDEFVKPKLDKNQQESLEFIQKTLKIADTAPYPPKGNTEVTTAFSDAADSISFGRASIEQAAEDFMNKAHSAIGQ